MLSRQDSQEVERCILEQLFFCGVGGFFLRDLWLFSAGLVAFFCDAGGFFLRGWWLFSAGLVAFFLRGW